MAKLNSTSLSSLRLYYFDTKKRPEGRFLKGQPMTSTHKDSAQVGFFNVNFFILTKESYCIPAVYVGIIPGIKYAWT